MKVFEKINPKHVQNTFGHFWERFWLFWNFEKFLIFLKIFVEDSTLMGHWAKKNFSKKLTQNMFKTRLDTFGNDFGLFCNFEKFLIFFENFRRFDPHEHWAKKIWKKLTQNMFKTRLDIFGHDFGHFCNFEKFFIILKIFEDSTFHGTLGK